MSAFPDWQKYAVHQRRPQTGCIPTAYELLLRAAGTPNVDFDTIQDDFDLDMNGGPARNNFDSVAQAIQKKYPTLIFHHEGFAPSEGAKKLNRVEQLLAQKKPVIVSIANAPSGGKGWHIMPIVDATSDELILLEYVDVNGNKRTKNLKKEEFVRIHDNYAGGDDIAFLGDPKVASPSS